MNATDTQLIAGLEQAAATQGIAPEDIDAHVADRLGVPLTYYFAYLLVAGAVDRYRDATDPQTAATVDGDRGVSSNDDPAMRARELVDEIGWLASRIYQETAGDGHAEVHASAASILRAVLELRADVRHLARDHAAVEAPGRDADAKAVGVGIDGR